MSLGLIKPGLGPAAKFYPRQHPLAGQPLEPIGFIGGKAVWPVMGGAEEQDDPDADPEGDEDDEEEEEDEDDKKSTKSKKTRRGKDDDEENDEDDEENSRPHRQAARYRTRLRAQEKENLELKTRLQAIEDKDKKPDEVTSRELTEAKDKADKLSTQLAQATAQLAFFRVNTIEWADPADAFALADREGLFEDVVDEDGTVDARELRRGLKDLARRKPHLVKKIEDDKKAGGRKSTEDDEDDEEEDGEDEPRSRRPKSRTMNSTRKGGEKTPDRAALAKRFPVLGRN